MRLSTTHIIMIVVSVIVSVLIVLGVSVGKSGILPPSVSAAGVFGATGGNLVVGSEVATSQTNTGSWRAVSAAEARAWVTARHASNGLDKQIQFDGVQRLGANKIIVTMVDNNITTADAYIHEICDWVSSTGVDHAADANCTGGGWRNLDPLGGSYTSTGSTTRVYEVYDGYFWNASSSPGSPYSTPVSNFIKSGNGRVLIRVYSTVASTTQHSLDQARIEVAVDPVYEPASFLNTSNGSTSGAVNRMIGTTASDNSRFQVTMPAISNAIDNKYYFENVKSYTGANTLMIALEGCASATSLTFTLYLWNFYTASWTAYPTTFTPTVCGTDTDHIVTFNSTTVNGFVLSRYISNGQVRVKIGTAAPASSQSLSIDRMYMMLGSVNTDTSLCEISWGTNASNNCAATRSASEAKTATPTTNVWTVTSVAEYNDADHYSLDNDDDANSSEHAISVNVSMPATPPSNALVTGIHFAAKFLSGSTSLRLDPQIRDYSAMVGTSGWVDTPSTDNNNAVSTYTWTDSWVNLELQQGALFAVNPDDGVMNMRIRTGTSTLTASSTTGGIDFLMGSLRWIEKSSFGTVLPYNSPTGALLSTGSEVATSVLNTGSWRGTFGNDSNTWTFNRTASGANALFYFDGVQKNNANKLIIRTEAANTAAGTEAFVYQICDWVSSTGVTASADSNCTTGGWRSLNPRGTATAGFTGTTSTTRNYEIYDGYFWDRSGASPGTVISTPLSNFIRGSDGRVLVRIYSTDNSSNGIAVDEMWVETAIDPVYEPAGFTKTVGGTTTNYISDLIGATSTGINGSDGNKFTIPQSATLTAMDFYYTFENVVTTTGMDTILVLPEVCASSASVTFTVYLWDYTNTTWKSFGSTITPTTCATDTEYAFAFNSYTVSGFNFSDYVSSGQMRVRFLTASGVAGTPNIQMDRLYVMLGAVNSSTSACEISWGTGTDANCANTRTVGEGKVIAPTTSVWAATSTTEYNDSAYWPTDNDDDATTGESANALNIGFNMQLPSYSTATTTHYAIKHLSGSTSLTAEPQLRSYDAQIGSGGWYATPGSDSNASATTYGWFDSWVLARPALPATHMYNEATGDMMLRFRTGTSVLSTSVTTNIDFAMMSLRWVTGTAPTISISVSDGGVAYGTLAVSSSQNTTSGGVNDTQVVTNNGTGTADLNVKGYNTSCWTLGGSIGSEQFKHEFSTTSGSAWTALTTSYQALATSILPSTSQNLDLRITTPSSTNCYTQQTAQVTVQAVSQ